MKRECECNHCEIGKPFKQGMCIKCWKFYHDKKYRCKFKDSLNDEQKRECLKLPSIIRRAGNFIKAAGEHIVNNGKHVTPEVYQARLKVCETCDFRTDDWRCANKKCGCNLPVKASWESSDCPEKKWPLPVIQDTNTDCQGCK